MYIRTSLAGLFTLLCLTLQSQAISFVRTNAFEVATTNTLSSEHWILANDIVIEGTVENDLFAAAVNIIDLPGTYEGNVWGAGSSVGFQGYAGRNVRFTGSLIQIDGEITGNLMAMGNTLKITPATHIGGDIALYGMSSIVEGLIDGDVTVAGNSITLCSEIGGNASLTATGEIILLPGTIIMGNLYYTSPKELVIPKGIVLGEIKRTIAPPAPINWSGALNGFLGALLIALPFTSLFPVTIAISTQAIRQSTLRCMSTGALFSLLLPAIGLAMVVSVPTLPAALILFSIWGILGYLGKILTAMVLGNLILRTKKTSLGNTMFAIVIGLFLIYLGIALPQTRTAVYLTSSWLGMGALILSAIRKRKMIIQVPKTLQELEKLQNKYNKQEK